MRRRTPPAGDVSSFAARQGRKNGWIRGPPVKWPPCSERLVAPQDLGSSLTGVVHRPIDVRQLSKTRSLRAWWAARDSNPIAALGPAASRLDRFQKTEPPRDLAEVFFRASGQNKRPSRGSPWKAWFSMKAEPLGRFTLRIEHAAVVAIDPRLNHESAHTDGGSLGGGQIEWPSWRWALRVEEHSSQRKPRHQCRRASIDCQ